MFIIFNYFTNICLLPEITKYYIFVLLPFTIPFPSLIPIFIRWSLNDLCVIRKPREFRKMFSINKSYSTLFRILLLDASAQGQGIFKEVEAERIFKSQKRWMISRKLHFPNAVGLIYIGTLNDYSSMRKNYRNQTNSQHTEEVLGIQSQA